MRFSIASFALAALATMAAANTVDFVSQDSTDRTIICTAQEGLATIANILLKGFATETVTYPTGWIGNCFAVSAGAPPTPGMLVEFSFNGWNNLNWFDISAIVNPNDTDGIKTVAPKTAKTPMSGCQTTPCTNQYNAPDDIATMSTEETEFVVTVGTLAPNNARRHPRDFVTGMHH